MGSSSLSSIQETASPLPLASFRVLDFGTAWAAPMAGQLLADMGAEVIKIESHAKMDGIRLGRPIVGDDVAGGDRGKWPELQPVFHGLNRNKLSVTVDLKKEAGVALVKDLAGRSDVVINNYSPGVMDRLGLGYEALRRCRPDIIFVAMPAAGNSGPLKDVLAYAPIVLSLSGLMSQVGYDDGALVGELQSAWSDATAALHAAMAAAAALRHRNNTGRGQYVEVAQWDATTSWLGEAVIDWTFNGREAGPQGNAHPRMAPHNTYQCLGEDQWVSIAVETDDQWEALCKVAEEDLGETARTWTRNLYYGVVDRRITARKALDSAIQDWTSQRTAQQMTGLLQGIGVPVFPVMNIGDQFVDPHFRARDAWVESEHPMVGVEWLYGQPWHLSETQGSVRRHAPLLGEHNSVIFGELLGVPEATLRHLVDDQVLY